jgi:hypothetical protein
MDVPGSDTVLLQEAEDILAYLVISYLGKQGYLLPAPSQGHSSVKHGTSGAGGYRLVILKDNVINGLADTIDNGHMILLELDTKIWKVPDC